MIVGHPPLRFVRNALRCGLCDERLPGSAAGATVLASYEGPVLTGVDVTGVRGGHVHTCGDLAESDEPPAPTRRTTTPRNGAKAA